MNAKKPSAKNATIEEKVNNLSEDQLRQELIQKRTAQANKATREKTLADTTNVTQDPPEKKKASGRAAMVALSPNSSPSGRNVRKKQPSAHLDVAEPKTSLAPMEAFLKECWAKHSCRAPA